MIRRVKGQLVGRELDRVEVLTASGLGYEVLVPATLLERLPPVGADVDLHTALVVRDDALELYGFASAADRELFLRLQTASGVGPRLALALLSSLPGPRIVRAIRTKDHDVLRTVSGVGKKTAERIALELVDKLDDLSVFEEQRAAPRAAEEAVQALRTLGYGARESEEAVHRALQSISSGASEPEVSELVRAALQHV